MWTAAWIKSENVDKTVVIVTKDINLRIKSDAIGIDAEDYYRDVPLAVREGNPVYSGVTQLVLSDEDMDSYYTNGSVNLRSTEGVYENSLVVATSENSAKKSLIGMVKDGKIIFSWTAPTESSALAQLLASSASSTLLLPPNSLVGGRSYVFICTVYKDDDPSKKNSGTYMVSTLMSPLKVSIIGGNRVASVQSLVVLDASSSHDPDFFGQDVAAI